MKRFLASAAFVCAAASMVSAQSLVNKQGAAGADTLILSRSIYAGNATTVSVGQTLPPGCVAKTVKLPTLTIPPGTTSVKVTCATATNNGTYPTVFNNDQPDGSFGVTSPIFLDNISKNGKLLGTYSVPTGSLVTSFSSKSELALNLSLDGKSITFVGYQGGPGFVTGPNQLDVSNSNTPGVIDPTNPVISQYYRAVAEVDADGNLKITDGNAYSGNNGRAAIKASGSAYYLTGNNNNGGLSKTQLTTTQVGLDLITSTGAEFLVPGQTPPPVPPNINMIGNFEITQIGYPTPDKAGKDNNFRGLTIYNNTLYVTKGSGGNGINTVYQVGETGLLPTGSTPQLAGVPITILPGFPTSLASGVDVNGNPAPVSYPFGIWFADPDTLYVCDEGDGTLVSPPVKGNVASAASQATAGIQKWIFNGSTWNMAYVLQEGLNIGIPYIVNTPAGNIQYPNPATDGCRNLTGKTNGDGTVDLYAVTSTVSTSGDQGADPNKLVTVKDQLKATSLPKGLGVFTTLREAAYGEVLRGIAFAPHE